MARRKWADPLWLTERDFLCSQDYPHGAVWGRRDGGSQPPNARGAQTRRRPNSRSPVSPSRWSGQAHSTIPEADILGQPGAGL